MNQTIELNLEGQPRQSLITIGEGVLKSAGNTIQQAFPKAKQCLVITDDTVKSLYTLDLDCVTYSIPAGETSKTLAHAEAIFKLLNERQFSRHDVIVALGGGVVGDLAGFCAALFKRGMKLVQIPTTLLAMVDSSVGGKTAVNLPLLKNGIGAFYQPHRVLIDPTCLKTLPEREYRAGMAEVVKYALIESNCIECTDTSFFQFLQSGGDIQDVIFKSCQFKTAIVSRDEHETTGLRAVLNFGHTFAHALEEVSHYKTFLHGEAVAIGMLMACDLSEKLNLWPGENTAAVQTLYEQYDLPTTPQDVQSHFKADPKQLLALMRSDKKNTGKQITLVLPSEKIGKVVLYDKATDDQILSVLN